MDKESAHTDRVDFGNALWLISQIAVMAFGSVLLDAGLAAGLTALVFFLTLSIRSSKLPRPLHKIPQPKWIGAIGAVVAFGFSVYATFHVMTEQPAEGTPMLTVLDAAMVEDAATETTLEDMDGTIQTLTVDSSTLDLFVRNDGSASSHLSRLELRLQAVWTLEECYPSGGPVGVSYAYDVVLPHDATPGMVIDSTLRQEVPAGEADRFTVTLGLAESVELDASLAKVFVLEAVLHHDVDQESNVGSIVVADRFPDLGTYWEETGDAACEQRNSAIAREVVAQDGIVSRELSALLLAHQR